MYQSLTLIITGRFIAKKNSRRILKNRRTGKNFSAPSEAFENYKTLAIQQIRKQMRGEGNLMTSIAAPRRRFAIDSPYIIDYLFGVKGKGLIDVDNAMASINDILQDAGVIDNDKNILKGWYEKKLDSKEWFVKVKITNISE